MVDATIVPAPKQRSSREETETVKRGETQAAWKEGPAKNQHKDKDARWTRKHGKSLSNDAAVHDIRVLEALFDKSEDVFRDSSYRSAEAAEKRGRARLS